MLFRHLSAEDFTNLLEGMVLPDHRRAHLQSCAHCLRKFESVQEVRSKIEGIRSEADEYIPEPDWAEFRSDVRNALLSRSVRRENASRNWVLRPALAWGFSLLLVVGLSVTVVVWNPRLDTETQVTAVEDSSPDMEELTTLAGVSQPDALDDLLHLSADEIDSLRLILDDVAQQGVSQQ